MYDGFTIRLSGDILIDRPWWERQAKSVAAANHVGDRLELTNTVIHAVSARLPRVVWVYGS